MLRADRRRPGGYTLIELLVSSALATVLIAGTASSIYVASQALDVAENATAVQARNARAVDQMLRDLRRARYFSERTANAVTCTVPDRDGNDRTETIRYAWSGTPGDPLTCQYNAEAPIAIVDNVQNLNLEYVTRSALAPPLTPPSGRSCPHTP